MDASQLFCLAKAKKIGMFDSGLGGLSVLSRFTQSALLKDKDYVYIGDTNRCPYGNRSYAEIKTFVDELADWLLQEGADALVMACNTSAALVADELKVKCAVPVVDLFFPTANYVAVNNIERVGVIATNSTAKSLAFSKAISSQAPNTSVYELGCPELVPIVERGLWNDVQAEIALTPYIKELVSKDVQAIVFGCTHYPFLEKAMLKTISKLTSNTVEALDPACLLTESISKVIKEKSSKESLNKAGEIDLVTTGDADKFKKEASLLMGSAEKDLAVRSVNLPKPVRSELGQKPVITSVSPA